VLIVPRLLALVIGLPLLTFLADAAAMFGAMLVAWVYGDISPDVFVVAAARRDRAQHLLRRPDQGAVHGAGDRHDRLYRGLR
jgi:ABC-type transporter Mla maintaining outer membrane lipid asymmetry permease subunit MlaE